MSSEERKKLKLLMADDYALIRERIRQMAFISLEVGYSGCYGNSEKEALLSSRGCYDCNRGSILPIRR